MENVWQRNQDAIRWSKNIDSTRKRSNTNTSDRQWEMRQLQRRLQMDDSEFQLFWAKHGQYIKIKGDILLVRSDRPWHPTTRREIYNLLEVCKELGFCLPKLVVETIAYHIQQCDVFQDYRDQTLELVVVWDKSDFHAVSSSPYLFNRPGLVIIFDLENELDILLDHWAPMDKQWLPDSVLVWMKKLVINWDRYRIMHYWRNRCAKHCGLKR